VEAQRERENKLVLDVVQAALGLISPEMRAISIVLEPGRVVLHLAVHVHNAQVDEDVEDLVFELEALQDRAVTVMSAIFVGAPDASWPGNLGRRVYMARES
jgi:hypothetical protein